MASIAPGADIAGTEIVLKTIAPRAPQHLLARTRLGAAEADFRDRQIVLVQAPAGYGKTSLLAQWRREHLARGGAVAWLRADERDEAGRFLLGLVHAVKSGCARPAFGRLLLDGAIASVSELDGATAWLAEVAQLSLDILLIVDEVERLPAAGAKVLAYLLHNAPQNLRFMMAGRRGLEAPVADLLAYGQGVLIGPELLRFRLDETIALVGERFGSRIGTDVCARLFEATDGWPLGLQLALAAMTHATDPRQAAVALASGPASLRDHLVGALFAKLSPEDDSFLTRISVVDLLHPDLCHALTGDPHAPEQLARLVRETPVFVTAEASTWCRLHALARDVLRTRLAGLPAPVQAELHGRAATWLAGQGMLEEAARHAHAAGQHQTAYELAERSLHDAVQQGHLSAVLDWLDLIPDAELEKRPRLRLAAAWALALGQRHEEAGRQVKRILDSPGADDTELRYECAMILSAAAYFADEPDRFLEIFEPWAAWTPGGESWLAQSHANRLAARAMLLGEPAQVRRCQQLVPRAEVGKGLGYLVRWGDHIVGLSYLAEGQLRLAEEVLLPALASAEADLGRRHPLACMFAATCAAIAYEDDRIDEAAALLANRLDMLERSAIPETLSVAYCTAARIAALQGIEHRALDLLEAMYAMGVTRRLPRLCIASLTEQVRMHAGRYRAQTCEALVHRIDDIVAQETVLHGPLWLRTVTLLQSLSHAGAAIAARRWQQALDALASAGEIAESMKMGRYRIEIMALRALALDQSGGEGRALLIEAINLAQTFNLTRLLADAHPALAEWARQVSEQEAQKNPGIPAMAAPHIVRADARSASGGLRALPSVVLTPKEREILELLAQNLSNKEIAVAATVGEGTVKWHLKNLFGKLDASSRKHAVRRALALGLLEGTQ
ncbi:LuxR C-terminal-related transcriptional regulator [Paraburkholderia sp. BL10I2N1]|uniref:helix-turn-helix transcriptional regulator n=1 Tax=Paraburkholderia sp. BL10I2N1 TaxID=1938796 RepID=UPI00106092FE|nr:LuxR C-terminal-related transcriptional regulator [Paraburkholderia sp. BL10I2N1]TDN57798.1 LuxR family transcriptional regulator [Paraburkholderia sp. BL10I2N1]